jgi:hypothetical protein
MVDQSRLGKYPLGLPNSGLPRLGLLIGGERGWTFVRRIVLGGLYRCFLSDNRRPCGVVALGLLGNALFCQGYVSNSLADAQVLLTDAHVLVEKAGALMGLHVVRRCAHDFVTWLRIHIDKCMGSFIQSLVWSLRGNFIQTLVWSLSGNFIPPNGNVHR